MGSSQPNKPVNKQNHWRKKENRKRDEQNKNNWL